MGINKKELEAEITRYFDNWYFDDTMSIIAIKPMYKTCDYKDLENIARYFAEYGYKKGSIECQNTQTIK